MSHQYMSWCYEYQQRCGLKITAFEWQPEDRLRCTFSLFAQFIPGK